MSVSNKLTSLANAIRDKSLTEDKLSLEDMVQCINRLTFDVDETKNLLGGLNDLRNAPWGNDYPYQVGRIDDSNDSPMYAWRTPGQHEQYLRQTIKNAKLNTLYVWKFYARADKNGDKVHSELCGGGGKKDFSLTSQWKLCISFGMLTYTNKPFDLYIGSVSTNEGNVSMTMPVLTELKIGGMLNPVLSAIKHMVAPLMGGVAYVA